MFRAGHCRRQACITALLLLAVVVVALTAFEPVLASGSDSESTAPRLVVVIAVPGLRADYLDRVLPHLGPIGLRRMLRRGARFTRAQSGLAFPGTEAAIATLATGAWPRRHGVVAARWWDRQAGCRTGPPQVLTSVPTLAGRLEQATNGAARTLTLAWSEVSARLAGGATADICCWFDPEALSFRARTASAPTEADPAASPAQSAGPGWLTRFQTARKLRRWRGKKWLRYGSPWHYADCAEDDRDGEGGGGFGTHFPHQLPDDDAALARAIACTPYADRLLIEVAVSALLAGAVGRDDVPDLLVLVPESLARIGERFGPQSHEVADALARFDLQLGLLLGVLDARVGAGRWTVILSGLHGMPPLATEAASRGLATPVLTRSLASLPALPPGAGEGEWQATCPCVPEALVFEAEREPMVWLGPNLYLRPGSAPEAPASTELVRATGARLLRTPGVHAVLTRSQFAADQLPTGRLAQQLRRSFHARYAGDLMVVPGPNARWLGERGPVGPWEHSTAIPVVAVGNGVRRGSFDASVTLASVAPMVAQLLRIPFSAEADAGMADGALRERERHEPR